jgi:hypothetical protein
MAELEKAFKDFTVKKKFIIIKTHNNQNKVIQIQISDLAEIERLQISKQTMETDQGSIENVRTDK